MTTFYIELTPYGWAVRGDTERLGLYATKRHAVAHAEQRRADLKQKGQEPGLRAGLEHFPLDVGHVAYPACLK
jgi:hypothetical protein